MTEPDVDWDVLAFRQWAAQRWPARAKFIRDGELDFDYFADAFRAGATASAERVTELEAALREVADDLEAEIKARAGGDLPRRVERDLEPVSKARALLKAPVADSRSASAPVDDSKQADPDTTAPGQ